VVLVSGTNGKTTTAAMLRCGWGGDVAGNVTGANMPEGHVAALCASRSSRVVLETDEAWLPAVVGATAPTVVVLLNLSRDQLDRANEVRQMAQRWRDCLSPQNYSGVVVANCADPLVVYAAQASTRVRWVDVPSTWRADAASCPHCTRALVYEGDAWSCSCGFSKPVDVAARLDSSLEIGTRSYSLDLALPGVFNDVNASLAATALLVLGVDVGDAMERIRTLKSVQGRYGMRSYGDRRIRLLLAKNPAGTAALLASIGTDDDIWVAINAQVADGKDPSWLYDVPFEVLQGRRISCLGERRVDLATRLTYAGVDCDVIDEPQTLREGATQVTLVANYTAFQDWMTRTTPC
jgi:UDP-N-acetylmuramyl tripeptide synthase